MFRKNKSNFTIKKTKAGDLEDILSVVSSAFGNEKEPQLVKDLLNDPTARRVLSLLAYKDGKPVGHILFTSTSLIPNKDKIATSILAPLAVIPEEQNQGIGGELIKAGLKILSKSDTKIVFVLGHPTYYPKFGFTPAAHQGFEAPYPIPEEHAEAWMLQFLGNYKADKDASEKVTICEALDKPEYWRE